MTDQRALFETAVVERMKESGFLEIEIRTECLVRFDDGYQAEIINAGWHYWNAALATSKPVAEAVKVKPHPDDIAVDRFAVAMKMKLADKRAQGYGGWDNPEDCSIAWLSELLRKHIDKGDPVDVGNFAMMIHQRGGSIE
jgi:hypothetical protein